MARIKPTRKNIHVDMTPFVDVAFLLLTFFILVAQFKPQEAVQVTTPASTATQKVPQGNIIEIEMDNKGRVFFGLAGQSNRIAMLETVAKSRNLSFTPLEEKEFSLLHNFGLSINQLKAFLAMSGQERKAFIKQESKGIPIDSTDNQLKTWLKAALDVQRKADIIIKGDKQTKYPVFNTIVKTLKDINQNQFQLETAGHAATNKKK